ncbi:MAG: peptidylprolyl isomerase [Niastella sp.]|nr:peptidylprolyl isomerase [Niastella sp.]
MTFLRKIIVATLCTTSVAAAHAQTLFTYGTRTVSKEEFLKAYNKNNTETTPTEQSYRDYLDLYTRFKVKVQAAMEARLDTLPNQKSELAAFRNQVVESFMNDEASIGVLVEEAMERSKKDIHVAHIFIAAGPSATAEQVKQAQAKANEAYARLQSGDDFTQTALAYSEDPAVKTNKGDLGYITVFSLPYAMENLVYGTPVGKYTSPLRSKNGYHLFKVIAERKAIGKMRAAQILLAFTPDATDAQKQAVAKRADSIYNALQKGGDFKQLAATFSDDNLTFQTGGEMMAFGVGRYTTAFESAAFGLGKDDEITRPVLTEFGYHIIKRLQHVPIPEDKANKQWLEETKQQVLQSDRLEVAKKVLYKKILQTTGFKKLPVNQTSLSTFTNNTIQNKKAPLPAGITASTPLFTIGKQTFRVKEWQAYLETIRDIEDLRAGKTNTQLLDQFIEQSAFDYYREHLETYNKDFAYQLNEFKEGNLLFEIMQRNIWDKAAADTIGLKKHYDAHKNNYWWEASAGAIILTAATEAAAGEARKKLEDDYRTWKKLMESSDGAIQADSGRFELGQIPVVERTNFQPKLITAPVKNETDNSRTFAYIIKIYSDREPRSFTDARGFVINDYQAALEDQWITQLKKKYPVKVNETVLKTLPVK